MPGFREIIIQQTTQTASSVAAESVRNRKPKSESAGIGEPPDRPALRAGEELIARHQQADAAAAASVDEQTIPAGIFDGVENRAEEKALLGRALRSQQPVHVLLVGDPGCGKSELLQEIAKLPRSRYAVGGATTSSGLIDYLLEKPNTQRLVVDELDKADTSDLYALYSLMESGVVTRLQHNATQSEKRTVWVFAAANTTEKLPEALASRFVIRKVPNYTEAEAEQIMARVLERREGLSRARAQAIAAAVAPLSQDPRDGIQVGRLAGPTGPLEPVIAEVLPGR